MPYPPDEAIPVVDLAGWRNGSRAARAAISTEADHALQRSGFMLVTNHGVTTEALSQARAAALRFFHSDADVKAAVRIPNGAHNGWAGLGTEIHGATYGIDAGPDLKESFSITPPVFPEHLRGVASGWYSDNLYPAGIPEMKSTWETLYAQMDELATQLLEILELAVDVDAGSLTQLCRHPMGMLTANWYPPFTSLHPGADQWRIAPHTDFGTVTVLDREPGIGGLQVQLRDGTWTDAPWVPGSLTINVGDLLTLWSGDRWPSARHRVLAPSPEAPAEELTSLVYFHAPSCDALIQAELPARSARNAVLAGDYLLGKVAQLTPPSVSSVESVGGPLDDS